jgi:hypothetical protein
VTGKVVGASLGAAGYTLQVTVTDLFYADNASGLCTTGIVASPCLPSTGATSTTDASIKTTYFAPVAISNPASCTRTSFAYTTATPIFLLDVTTALPNPAEQATQSAQALLVTTYVSTLSTNLGGQEVTASICEVYLREGAVAGINPDTKVQSECIDPRSYACSVAQVRASETWVHELPSTSAACRTDQAYPPVRIQGTGTSGVVGSTSKASAGFRIKIGGAFGAASGAGAVVAAFVTFF